MKIETKYDIGQEVFVIGAIRKDCIDRFIISWIGYCLEYGIFYKTTTGDTLYEYYYDIFATEKEAIEYQQTQLIAQTKIQEEQRG